jgi:hypothetical protein
MFAIQKKHDNHINHYLHPIQEELKGPKHFQACSFFYFIVFFSFFSLSLCILFFLFVANHKECNDHVDHHLHSIQGELRRRKFFQAQLFIYLLSPFSLSPFFYVL